MQEILKAKKDQKSKKPSFTRTDSHKKKRLNPGWRKPKGYHNKMRLQKKGYKRIVKTGYGTPASLRGANERGLKIVTVHTKAELLRINPEKEGALLAGTGRKKKTELIVLAKEKGITIINLQAEKYQEKTDALLKQKQERKAKLKEKAKERQRAEKAAEKKKEEAAKEEEQASDDDKKQEEKKELDKVLTSKKGM